MRVAKRGMAAVLAAVLTLMPGVAHGQEGAEPAPSPAPLPTAGGGGARVTLVTGDRVDLRTVGGEPVAHVEPGEGRDGVRFGTQRAGEHLYVVPSDAIGLIEAGRLDRRLFDVAGLVSSGYDDAHRSDLPLIVQAERAGERVPDAAVAEAGAEVQALPAASASGVRQPKARAGEFWAEVTGGGARGGEGAARSLDAGIGTVWLDGLRHPSLDVSVPQIGAPAAWDAGYTGAGVTVAVLDSGVDASHPDLAGTIVGSMNFTEEADTDDLDGHGTHVAATIVGSGAASGGRNRGVAPDAGLLVGKVCDASGNCPESAILEGMAWAAGSGARVVNLSLGGVDTPGADPLEAAIDTLSARHGTLFVVAAGNSGPQDGSLDSPASADAALAVGAVDDGDRLAGFSSRGPRVGDAALKPEITAPGVGIVAARARNGTIGEPAGDQYVSLDGTSMATPHVAGAAALVAQRHPGWTGAQLGGLLVGAASTADGVDAFAQGAGRVDLGRAVGQDLYAEPSVVSAGRQPWPHDDDEPLTRTITYRNPGPEPVTLALAVHAVGPDGETAPAGVFALGRDGVTVPAGGEAGVELTVDTSADGPDGHYSARVVATAGDTVVTTPVAVDREPESYELTVVHRDRHGDPAGVYATQVYGLDQELWQFPSGPDGTFTVRLPRGRYLVGSTILTRPEAARPDYTMLVQPLVELDRDRTVELDARQSGPFEVSFERGDVQPRWAFAGYERQSEAGPLQTGVTMVGRLDGVTTGTIGPEVARDEMISQFQGVWTAAGPSDTGRPRDETYNLAWFDYGRLMRGQSRRVRDAQLARVRTDLRAIGEGRIGARFPVARPPGMDPVFGTAGTPTPLPARGAARYNTRGVEWSAEFLQAVPDPGDPGGPPIEELWLDSNVRDYEAGRTYHERWNAAVLGPVVSDGSSSACTERPEQTSERTGDLITVTIDLLSDAAGHTGCGSAETRTSLSRDGETIGETPYDGYGEFEVPAEAATYRVETDLTRHPVAVLSTRVTAAWTFRSQHVAGDEPEPLPLMAVRFAPELDAGNRAPAGRSYRVPLTIDRQGDLGRISRPTVEASFDDGRTWSRVRVERRRGGGYVASLTHPPGGGFVSLRATAADQHGNAVEQTIIRAYQLTP